MMIFLVLLTSVLSTQMVVYKEGGGGPCLFNALARQIKGDPRFWKEVQDKVIDFLERNPEHESVQIIRLGNEDFDEIIRKFKENPTEWGFEWMGAIAALAYGIEPSEVSIVQTAKNDLFELPQRSQTYTGKRINIVNWGEWHFDSVFPYSDSMRVRSMVPAEYTIRSYWNELFFPDKNAFRKSGSMSETSEKHHAVFYKGDSVGEVIDHGDRVRVQIGGIFLRVEGNSIVADEAEGTEFTIESRIKDKLIRHGAHINLMYDDRMVNLNSGELIPAEYPVTGEKWKPLSLYIDHVQPKESHVEEPNDAQLAAMLSEMSDEEIAHLFELFDGDLTKLHKFTRNNENITSLRL